MGLAIADAPDQPFIRYGDKPIFDPGEGLKVEDPCVFYFRDHYEMVCKDLTGKVTGEFHAAVHLTSPDGVHWQPMDPVKAWSRSIAWDDGTHTTQGSIERPFVLLQHGEPTYLFAATADGPGPFDGRPGHYHAINTWNMVIPLT